jgi:multidrug resistance efflux pump
MKSKAVKIVAIIVAIALGAYFLLRPVNVNTPPVQPPAPQVIAAEGKLKARPGAEMNVGTEVTARIERFLGNEGEHVGQGQMIALLESQDLTARLQQAEADLAVAKAKRDEVAAGSRSEEIKQAQAALQRTQSERTLAEQEFNRVEQLYHDKFESRAMLDNSESTYKVAAARVVEAEQHLQLLQSGPRRETLALLEAQVSQADANVRYMRSLLNKTRVVSPISGTLIERYLDVGEVVIPEKPLVAIADTQQLRINAEVDETDAGRLKLGDAVEITAYAYPGKVYKGRIEEIADYVGKREIKPNNPAVNLGLKIIQVKIALLEATPLKLGMTVDVRISTAKQ